MARATAIRVKATPAASQPSSPLVAARPKAAMEATKPPSPIRITRLRPSRSDSRAQ